jgi:hypothetical protein
MIKKCAYYCDFREITVQNLFVLRGIGFAAGAACFCAVLRR